MPGERNATASKPKAVTKQISRLPAVLTYSQDDLEKDISNLFYEAWRFRGSEHHLYPLYNHILSLSCWNLRHPNLPRTTLVSCPQPLFGEPPPPKTGEEANTKSEPKAKPGSRTKSTAKAKPDSEDKPKGKARSLKQIPDFARVFVFGDDGKLLEGTGLSSIHGLAEFYELKALNCNHRWWSRAATRVSEEEVPLHLPQVYNAAMAGFAHNPEWKQIHATLIVGAYFTQVVWSSRPSDEALKPLTHARVPKTILEDRVSSNAYDKVITTLIRQVPMFEARVAPECLFYNAPMFAYTHNPEDPNHPGISLSSQFLRALARPIKKLFPQLSPGSTLFEVPIAKPRVPDGTHSRFEKVLEQTLIQDPIAKAQEQARALGYRFPGEKPATPTPPNSVAEERFKGSVKNIKSLTKSGIVTRKKSLQSLLAVHEAEDDDDDISGEEDSGSEDEGDE